MKVKVHRLNDRAIIPKKAHAEDVGFDLHTIDEGWVFPFRRKTFRTGLAMEPEPGYELQIRPRSGLARKHGLTVLNSPATIDPNYRGDIGVIIYNSGWLPFKVKKYDRIAQGVFKPYEQDVEFKDVRSLSETERNVNGYGSSGIGV